MSRASARASVNMKAAVVADVPSVNHFWREFGPLSILANAVCRMYFYRIFPIRLVIVILLYDLGL